MSDTRLEQRREKASERMPVGLWRMLMAALAIVTTGGLYLYGVRGAAMLMELATVLCL